MFFSEQNQNVTKVNINWFLAETGQDQHLKLNPQYHILFYKVFFDKTQQALPDKYLWQEYFKSPPGTHFFPIPPFQNLGLAIVTNQQKEGGRA